MAAEPVNPALGNPQVDQGKVSNSKLHKFQRIFKKKHTVQACFLGIAAPGKTSFAQRIVTGNKSMPSAEPTETFVEFTATHKKHVIIMREIGSSETLRNLWKHEVGVTNVFAWFVDASNPDSFADSSESLLNFVKHNSLQDQPWLILVTKIDKEGAKSVEEVVKALNLEGKIIKVGCVLSVSSATGKGVEEAVDWMVKACEKNEYKVAASQ